MIIKIIMLINLLFINDVIGVEIGEVIKANKFNGSTFHIGSIQQSLLTESQFQAEAGDCWVQMKGQDVLSSDYSQITGIENLPNADGLFLRTIGGNAPLLGQIQEDAFQGHFHNFSIQSTTMAGGGSSSPWTGGGTQVPMSSYNITNKTNYITDGINGTPRVANETRPVNVGVNTFIKINRECNKIP